jgi:hypothetical protein
MLFTLLPVKLAKRLALVPLKDIPCAYTFDPAVPTKPRFIDASGPIAPPIKTMDPLLPKFANTPAPFWLLQLIQHPTTVINPWLVPSNGSEVEVCPMRIERPVKVTGAAIDVTTF